MLTLSESAVEVVDTLLHRPEVPEDAGLRILPGGDSQLAVELASEPVPGDQIIEDGGARVFVDAELAPMLDNAQLNAHRDGDQIAFGLTPTVGGSDNNHSSGP